MVLHKDSYHYQQERRGRIKAPGLLTTLGAADTGRRSAHSARPARHNVFGDVLRQEGVAPPPETSGVAPEREDGVPPVGAREAAEGGGQQSPFSTAARVAAGGAPRSGLVGCGWGQALGELMCAVGVRHRHGATRQSPHTRPHNGTSGRRVGGQPGSHRAVVWVLAQFGRVCGRRSTTIRRRGKRGIAASQQGETRSIAVRVHVRVAS